MTTKADFWQNTQKPIIALAPMAGYTDSAYRQIAKTVAPNIVCFSEFTNVNALKFANKEKIMRMLDFKANEKPLIMQLFGTNVDFFVEAAKKLEDIGMSGIDINMGCPAKQVVATEAGSALLRNMCLAGEIVNAMSKTVQIPVSVKTRLGYETYDEDHFLKFGLHMQEAGAKLITVHGRTKKQAYSGEANWKAIHTLKKHLKIPVIGNGDIKTAQDAVDKIGNLDGVMIGRATMGNPWLLAEIYAALNKQSYQRPGFEEQLPLMRQHAILSVENQGEKYGVLEMRKHLSTYVHGFENASHYRMALMKTTSLKESLEILDQIAQVM